MRAKAGEMVTIVFPAQRTLQVFLPLERIKDVLIMNQRLAQPVAVAKQGNRVMQQNSIAVQRADELVAALADQTLEEVQCLIGIRGLSQQQPQRRDHLMRCACSNALQVLARPLLLTKRAQVNKLLRTCAAWVHDQNLPRRYRDKE